MECITTSRLYGLYAGDYASNPIMYMYIESYIYLCMERTVLNVCGGIADRLLCGISLNFLGIDKVLYPGRDSNTHTLSLPYV